MLKKIATLVLLTTIAASTAQARHGGFMDNKEMARGGFKGPGIAMMTVKDVMDLKDDAAVRLKGKIERSLGNDKYLFQDSTGSIEVDISEKKWHGQTVTPNDTVEIFGELDKDMLSQPEVDVKKIRIVK